MSFSYLKSIQELTDETVYQRGLRVYLDGGVLDYKNLPLDNWRLYEVVDNRNLYRVKFPIAHLLLSNVEKLTESLGDFCSCECEYYKEYGSCKHIVAVAAKIDREFIKKEPPSQNTNSSALDNFFEVEKQKKESRWLSNIEHYISIADTSDSADLMSQMLRDMVSEVFKQTSKYEEFLKSLDKIILESVVDFKKEKRIINIITNSKFLIVGGKPWWTFWKKYINEFDPHNQSTLLSKLWIISRDYPSAFWDFEVDFVDLIRNSSTELKGEILSKIEKETADKKTISDFCLKTEYVPWIEKNLDVLDPLYLIQISHLIPDKSDEIEIRLMNQIKLWSDFLPTGNYQEISEIFKQWKSKLGESALYDETIKYVKESHKKKKKLINLLND